MATSDALRPTSLKRYGRLLGGSGFPLDEQGFAESEMEIPFFKVKDLAGPLTLKETDNYVSRETAARLGATIFPESSIVFAKVGAALLLNRFRVLGCDGCLDNNMMAFEVKRPHSVPYFLHLLNSSDMSSNFNSGPVPSVNTRQVGALSVTVPAPIEQQRIAAYLDASCAAIDAAVAAKRRQLATLDALKSSILLQTLTLGINKNVQTRVTGVPVLPFVPSGWGFRRLKAVATIRYGLGQPPIALSSGVAMIRATDVDAGTIRRGNFLCVDPDDLPRGRNPYLKSGEIIVVRSGAYTGDSAIVPPDLEGMVAGYDMVVTVTRASPRFVAYCLLSRYVLEGQLLLLTLRAAQPHLNAEELGSILLALPPTLKEQEAIADFIAVKLDLLNGIVVNIQDQIATVNAYRKSLIHECVTGQRRITEADINRVKAHG